MNFPAKLTFSVAKESVGTSDMGEVELLLMKNVVDFENLVVLLQ